MKTGKTTLIWIIGISVILLITSGILFGFNKGKIPWAVEWIKNPGSIIVSLSFGLFLSAALLDQFIALFFKEDEHTEQIRKESQAALKEGRSVHKQLLVQKAQANREKMAAPESTQAQATYSAANDAEVQQRKNLEAAQVQLAEIKEDRRKSIRYIAFLVGLILAISGVRVLTNFIDYSGENSGLIEWQQWSLTICDIIFTASLLSGGTSGVNRFFDLIRSQLDKNTDT